MKYRLTFMAGAALGYVLGTRAGRERYEQIVRASRRLGENPRVQEAAETLRSKGGVIAEAARERVPEQIGQRMPGRHRDTSTGYAGKEQTEHAASKGRTEHTETARPGSSVS